jgi:hypothetical protein
MQLQLQQHDEIGPHISFSLPTAAGAGVELAHRGIQNGQDLSVPAITGTPYG